MTDPTNPILSAPSGSDIGEGVTQMDRDAAAEIVRIGAPGLGNGNKVIAGEIKGGLHDAYAVVQTFARHRLSTPSSTLTPDAEAVVARLNSFTTCGCGDDDWPLLRHDTVHLIDALSATPAIRDQAFEEAARVADDHRARISNHHPDDKEPADHVAQGYGNAALNIAVAIRALKGAPPSPIENDDGR